MLIHSLNSRPESIYEWEKASTRRSLGLCSEVGDHEKINHTYLAVSIPAVHLTAGQAQESAFLFTRLEGAIDKEGAKLETGEETSPKE